MDHKVCQPVQPFTPGSLRTLIHGLQAQHVRDLLLEAFRVWADLVRDPGLVDAEEIDEAWARVVWLDQRLRALAGGEGQGAGPVVEGRPASPPPAAEGETRAVRAGFSERHSAAGNPLTWTPGSFGDYWAVHGDDCVADVRWVAHDDLVTQRRLGCAGGTWSWSARWAGERAEVGGLPDPLAARAACEAWLGCAGLR